jgi:hypothetical protein
MHTSKDRGALAIQVAAVDAALGKSAQAFTALEAAYQDRVGSLILLNATPVYQPLRLDPRFNDLARRVGLPPIALQQ